MSEISINTEKIVKVIESIKPVLRPTKDEIHRAMRLYNSISDLIKKTLSNTLPELEFIVELEGSLAKGTALHGDLDIDIFILLRKDKINNDWLKLYLINPLVKALTDAGYKVRLKYASHPYINLLKDGLNIDIVPAKWAESVKDITTPVDRTPFHTRFVKESLKNGQQDDVRLLKKFFKRLGIYGAEINIEGFSGYLCELLIIKYGSFLETIKSIIKWREREVLSIRNISSYEINVFRKTFRDAVLIFPDPVDERRNAAASVSRKALATAMFASYEFLINPRKELFIENRAKKHKPELNSLLRSLSETHRTPIFIIFKIKDQAPPDNAWGETKKAGRSMAKLLRNYDFIVSDLRFKEINESLIIIYVELFSDNRMLPKYKLYEGPRKIGPYIIDFMHKHLMRDLIPPWITDDGRIFAISPRKYRDSIEIIKEYINNHHFKNVKPLLITDDVEKLIRQIRELIGENREHIEELHYWLTEAVLKRPSWLSSIIRSDSSKIP